MKVNIEDVSTVKKIVHVEIPEDEVARELNKAYKALKNNVKLKGFRPGKAPLSLLEKRFSKEVETDVSGQLIQTSYPEALGKAELKPLGEPVLDRADLKKGEPYKYSATVEIRPPVADLKLENLEFNKQVYSIRDEDVEEQLRTLQKRQAQLKTVDEDRPAKERDVVIIDYEGFKDGQPFDPARKTENFQVEIGSGRILEDLDKGMVGMRVNDTKEIKVHFPEDYYNKDLASRDVTFKVTLKEIKEEILPELDDEFAKDLNEYQTLADLKKAIRNNLEREHETESNRKLRQDILDCLIGQSDFELPSGLVHEELTLMVRDAQALMAQRGISMERTGQTQEGLYEKYRPLAEKRVREYLLMEKIIEQKDITLTDEMLEKAYSDFAETLSQPVETIKDYYKNDREAFELFKRKALEKQAIKYIMDNSKIENVQIDKGTKVDQQATAS
jgi:trigger factor